MTQPDLDPSFDGPLSGVRVLALENYVAGPLASMLLADWGADVVKVEPESGDTYRSFPPVRSEGDATSGVPFARVNRSKRSVTLRLTDPDDAETFRGLVGDADVLLENLKPGALDKLGLGWEALSRVNPQLVMVSISGFGQRNVQPGPYVDMPAFDLIGQAMGGLTYTTGTEGDPPLPLGFPLIDTVAADWAATATLLGLRQLDRHGHGQHLDISMYDVSLHLNEYQMGAYGWSRTLPRRGKLASSAPFELLAAGDGYFAIAVSGQPIFRRFCAAIGHADLADDPRFADGTLRREHMDDVLGPLIEQWAADLTVEQVVEQLGAHGVPASPVQDVAQVFASPHTKARGMVLAVPDPVLGKVEVVGNPVKGTDMPPTCPRPAPQLGSANDDIAELWPKRAQGSADQEAHS